jgi:hypothetical protein
VTAITAEFSVNVETCNQAALELLSSLTRTFLEFVPVVSFATDAWPRERPLCSCDCKIFKERKRNHEDQQAGDADRNNRGSTVRSDPQSFVGTRRSGGLQNQMRGLGADAAGKPAAKIPSLVSDEAKKLSDADLSKAITDTAKHPAGVKSLPADDVKGVVEYIRSLQK